MCRTGWLTIKGAMAFGSWSFHLLSISVTYTYDPGTALSSHDKEKGSASEQQTEPD